MRIIKRIKCMFYFALFFLLLMSASILIMPMAVKLGETDRIMTALVGFVFWASAIIGYALLFIANRERRWFISNRSDGNIKMGCRSGMLTFFSNVPATIADVVMIVSLLLMVCIYFTRLRNEYIAYILLFLFSFSLNVHAMFNGRIYKVTKYKRVRRDYNYE